MCIIEGFAEELLQQVVKDALRVEGREGDAVVVTAAEKVSRRLQPLLPPSWAME